MEPEEGMICAYPDFFEEYLTDYINFIVIARDII